MKNRHAQLPSRHKQLGLSLVEIFVSLGILAGVTAGVATLSSRYTEDTRMQIVGHHLQTFGEAAHQYVNANRSDILTLFSVNPGLNLVVDTQLLRQAGYLPDSFSDTNADQQTSCAVLRQRTGTDPVTGDTIDVIEGLAYTESDTPATTAIDDVSLGLIAATIGASGGAMYSSSLTTVNGVLGSWQVDRSIFEGNSFNVRAASSNLRCTGSAGGVTLSDGHPAMALWLKNESATTGFLYRDEIPGRPELNRMNTDLNLGDNLVNGIMVLDPASPSIACTAANTGSVATDMDGKLLTCQSSEWKTQGSMFWEDPVDNVGSLPTCNASRSGQTRIVRSVNTSAGGAIYHCNGAAPWVAIGEDVNGDLRVNRNIMATNQVRANAAFNLNGANVISMSGTNRILDNITTANISGRTTTGDLYIETAAILNAACPPSTPNGVVRRDNAGIILSCQDGVWKAASGGSSGIGLEGFLAPFKGQNRSGSCWSSFKYTTGNGDTATQKYLVYTYFTWSGSTPMTRVRTSYCDSGWVAGIKATCSGSYLQYALGTLDLGSLSLTGRHSGIANFMSGTSVGNTCLSGTPLN